MERKHCVNLLKVAAILLIFNSHSDALYPDKLSALATGGALGNSIFFIISGYFTRERMGGWRGALSRYVRLYLPVYMVLPVYALTQPGYFGNTFDIKRCFEVFIWPTPYWFVSASFVSYLMIYVYIYHNKRNKGGIFTRFTLLIAAIYMCCYIFGVENKNTWVVEDGKLFGLNVHFKCIYCFYLYILGYHIKSSAKRLNGKAAIALSLCCFILTYAIKILMQMGLLPMRLQILTQACVVGFAVGALYAALFYEDWYRRRNSRVISCLDAVSRISLEAYVVQILLIPFAAKWIDAPFPMNYAITLLLVAGLSACLYNIDGKILKVYQR